MASFRIKFPILVRKKDRGYSLSPLLFSGPEAADRDYLKAKKMFEKEVIHSVKSIINENDYMQILWYCFSPETETEIRNLEIKSGRNILNFFGMTVFFSAGGIRFAVLPYLNKKIILLGNEDSQNKDEFSAEKIYQKHFRELENAEIPEMFFASQSDTVINFETMYFLPSRKKAKNRSERRIFGEREFNGRTELEKLAENLNSLYPDDLMTAYFREKTAAEVQEKIFGDKPVCLVLIGPKGCGKTAILHQAFRNGLRSFLSNYSSDFAEFLFKFAFNIWLLDPERLIAGMRYVGQWERRAEAIFRHLYSQETINEKISQFSRSRFRNMILPQEFIRKPDFLYIRNTVSLFYTGMSSDSSLTVADVLFPYLERKNFGFIAEATPEEWSKVRQLNRSFSELFYTVNIAEMEKTDIEKIVIQERLNLEKESADVKITNDALKYLFLSDARFRTDTVPPKSLIDILTQTVKRHIFTDTAEIRESFKSIFHYNDIIFDREKTLTDESILNFLDSRIVGQNAAKRTAADVIHTVKAELNDPTKPSASLLFIGPTGAGKTELAKAMAEFLFESERYLVRFNMNEYADAESVSRLIGDFKNPEGTLTVQVSRRKACVLLLDEIEKAHPSVHDLLLQVLGEGRLTNSLGAVTDFKYAVIIMTSNIGADKAGKTLGFSDSTEDSSSVYRKAVEDYFRPEFINRIDSITVFEKLKFNDIKKITFIQIRKLLQREGFLRRAVFLRIEKDCFNAAAEQGFDSAMGARALVRSIEKLMTFPIAETLASSKHENPVLLNLFMKEGRISVDVLLLNYLKEVPRKSISVNLKSVNSAEIEKILDSIQELETSLLEDPDREDRNKKFLYWKITEKIREIKDYILTLEQDLNSRDTLRHIQHRTLKQRIYVSRVRYGDLIESTDYDSILKNLLQAEKVLFDGEELRLLQNLTDLEYQRFFSNNLRKNNFETAVLSLYLIEELNESSTVLKTMKENYENILNEISEYEIITDRTSELHFRISGFGIGKILQNETGFHLHFRSGSPPSACFVLLSSINEQQSDIHKEMQKASSVIRIYHSESHTADFRTGLAFNDGLTESNWKIMLQDILETDAQ